MAAIVIRPARMDDVPAITEIQNALIATTAIEWRDEPHTVEDRVAWLREQEANGCPVHVADHDGEVVGFTAFGDFRDTTKWPGYWTTVEHSIHVRRDHWGGGVGRMLVESIAEVARRQGRHVLVAAVDGENEASLRFHEQLGFREVARMPEVGVKFGKWLDLVLLALRLDERPSPT